eukprot:CAMPEP_0119331996 /NCGR_PEP_ID=MMETSP1333-20130426/81816_1 /TAXON_ID=418940 /ORGANISM="Scyphosphaera apsteinii, Strain RCC1455" /LENGTH=211 /DNA_ID=CAMNT_0007341727 /DNA_START=73 /DNA_END=708 /DNA_ORIENTATION=-
MNTIWCSNEHIIRRTLLLAVSAVLPGVLLPPSLVHRTAAASVDIQSDTPLPARTYQLVDDQFSYQLNYPADWKATSKPVRTHLSEALFQSPMKGVSLGITIDPVKIASLEQFGTAEQVAQRVLAVEENRDGVFSVELRGVTAQSGQPSYYTIEYQVESSRGKKVYLCKYCIAKRRLYVLQAQAGLDSWANADVRSELQSAVDSFNVMSIGD